MSEVDQNDVSVDTPTSSDAPVASSAPAGDELDSFIQEWDRATGASDKPAAPANSTGAPAPAAEKPTTIADLLQETQDALRKRQDASGKHGGLYDDPEGLALAQQVDRLIVYTIEQDRQRQAEYEHRREGEDGAALLEEAKHRLKEKDIVVPEGWMERWLASEYALNNTVRQAWDQRHQAPETSLRILNRAIKDMVEEASRIPAPYDREATEDRAMVTAAVRGKLNTPPPGESDAGFRRRVERMTPGELEKLWEDNGWR